MFVGILQLDLRIPGAFSLKDKRRVIRRVKDRASNKFNIAIAEVDYLDEHRLTRLGVTTVANDRRVVQSALDQVVNLIESQPDIELLDYQVETI
ncbi:MAG: DUF503 domain-containing protein [Planctomycetota bacterium]